MDSRALRSTFVLSYLEDLKRYEQERVTKVDTLGGGVKIRVEITKGCLRGCTIKEPTHEQIFWLLTGSALTEDELSEKLEELAEKQGRFWDRTLVVRIERMRIRIKRGEIKFLSISRPTHKSIAHLMTLEHVINKHPRLFLPAARA